MSDNRYRLQVNQPTFSVSSHCPFNTMWPTPGSTSVCCACQIIAFSRVVSILWLACPNRYLHQPYKVRGGNNAVKLNMTGWSQFPDSGHMMGTFNIQRVNIGLTDILYGHGCYLHLGRYWILTIWELHIVNNTVR